MKKGDEVRGGDIIGTVQETNIVHKVMVPPTMKGGRIREIRAGKFTVDETVCILEDGSEIRMLQRWPVRVPRPVKEKLNPDVPLITGQRILDGLFPIAKGGTAAIRVHSGAARRSRSSSWQSGRMPRSSSTSVAANAATR